jgi:hypothetical protein
MYKTSSNILLSRLTSYAEEIIGNHQCGFRRSRSAADHIFCIRKIHAKKWEYNEAVHQLFIDLMKAYDSVWREVLYNILLEFVIPMKLVSLCVSDAYSGVRVDKHLVDIFPVRSGLKQKHALWPLLFNCALECAIRRVHVNQDGLKLNVQIGFWFMLMLINWAEPYIL